MRRACLVGLPLLALLVAAASCGGSSSETPWPAEPSPSIIAPPPSPALVATNDAGAPR